MSTRTTVTPFFTPTQISGCQLWLDGADPNGTGILPANNGTVSTWVDKSGRVNNGTTAAGTLPYSTQSRGVVFNGSSYYTVPNNTFPTGNTNYSFFIIASTGLANYYWFLGAGVTTAGQAIGYVTYPNGTIENGWWTTNFTTAAGAVLANQTTMLESIYSSPTLTTLVNGSSRASSSSLGTRNNPSGPNLIGARPDSTPGSIIQAFVGVMNEIILFASGVSLAQQQQIEGYLAWKWGLQSSLPATHPYKNSPIPPLLNPPTSLPRSTQSLESTWSPLLIPGCSLWLDARDSSTLTLSGSSVTQWRDKSGSNYSASPTTATLTSSNTVLIGSNGLSFANFKWRTKFTSFFVSKGGIYTIIDTRPTTNGIIYVFTANYSLEVVYSPAGGAIEMKDTLLAQGTSVVDPNVFSLLTTGYNNGTTVTPYAINGSPRASVATAGSAAADTTLTQTLRFNEMASTQIAETIFYNANLTNSQYQQVEGYLAWKWNLQGLLPSSHPYKSAPPFTPSVGYPAKAMVQTASWNPTRISGCGLWLDGADKTTLTYQSGNNVSIWTDKSAGIQAQFLTNAMASARWTAGSNSTGSTGATNYPVSGSNINGVNALYFNQAVLQAITTQNVNTRSYFLVLQLPSNSTGPGDNILWPATWVSGYARGASLTVDSSTFTLANQNVANLLVLNVTPKNPTLVSVTFNNGTPGMWNAGGGTTTATGQSSSSLNFSGSTDNYLWIGGASGIFTSTGFILGEFLEYNSALTTSQRQQVEGYLAWKWGVQKSLPANHPWVNWPPPP
jgi:hypothetical protein